MLIVFHKLPRIYLVRKDGRPLPTTELLEVIVVRVHSFYIRLARLSVFVNFICSGSIADYLDEVISSTSKERFIELKIADSQLLQVFELVGEGTLCFVNADAADRLAEFLAL